MTPIQIKIQVLDSCMYMSYFYGCECWWKIDSVARTLLLEERKILKRILGVKPNTPDDILYVELKRCDIITKTKQRQFNFYKQFKKLKRADSIARKILYLCENLEVHEYYESLLEGMIDNAVNERKTRLCDSEGTYSTRYVSLTDCSYCDPVYNQFMNESKRRLITKWRLSCHRLRIETGRLESPKIERTDRTDVQSVQGMSKTSITFCLNVRFYDRVRNKYPTVFSKHDSVKGILNPSDVKEADVLGSLLRDIEKVRQNRGMEFVDC